MKTNISFYIFWCAILVAGIQFTSCKKDEMHIGQPAASKVSTINNPDSTIAAGKMGDWITLQGTNLAEIKEIRFNDVDVDLKKVYVENNRIYLQIPVKMPAVISNKLYVVTAGGETSYDFNITIPDLALTGMFNEYTLPGDTIRIYGRFLQLYEVDSQNSTVVFGDTESPVISSTDTYITTKVPLNVKSNVKVRLKNQKYKVEAVCPGYYQDKNNVITTFDSDFPYTSSTGQDFVGAWTSPKPTSGKFIKFEVDQQKYPDGLGWFYLMENSYTYTLDMIQHPEKYVLKFELNMALPIQRTKFFIYYYWAVGPTAMGGETFTVQTMGKWQTVSIPLEKIIPMGITDTGTSFSLNMRVENAAPVERVAMYFDNLRIYKKGD